MVDLSEVQPGNLIKQNADMLIQCVLFDNGGNYSVDEIAWYRGQMDEIDKLLEETKTKRRENMVTVLTDVERLKKDPAAEFKGAYGTSIQQLSAKEGLGKTFGQPRRLTQERLRAEMTKCESAQQGVDQLIDKLEELCKSALDDRQTIHNSTAPATTKSTGKKHVVAKTTSVQIRITLVQALRCIRHYANHLAGFA